MITERAIVPPEVVKQATLDARRGRVLSGMLADPELTTDAEASVKELHQFFPHLDAYTLMAFCGYIADMATGFAWDETDPEVLIALHAMSTTFLIVAAELSCEIPAAA